jgi:membrane-bound serine protease (ClpP class)
VSPFLLAAETSDVAQEGGDSLMIGVAVAFMVVAIGLFFLEILLPSFGLITLVGVTCVVISLIAAFSVSRPVGFAFVAVVVVSIPFVVYLAVKMFRRTSLAFGPEDTSGARGNARAALAEDAAGLVPGARGVVLTTLRPSGTANFDGRKVSVVTRGEMVEAGVQVEVLRVEGIRTVVRPVQV